MDLDSNGYIRNRIVRKDTHLDPSAWLDATRWVGDMRPTAIKDRLPMEYYCEKVVQDRPEAQYVVPALKCEVDFERSLYRLYLPYCPYGDLGELIQSHLRS